MPRRSALLRALVLSSFAGFLARSARAQAEPMSVTILRQTAVRSAPSLGASPIAFIKPSTFEVTQFEVTGGFVRLLLAQIGRRNSANGYGYLDTTDVAVDSAINTNAVRAQPVTPAPVRPTAAPSSRPATVAASHPGPASRAPLVSVRSDTLPAPKAVASLSATSKRAGELTIRPDAPPPTSSAVDSPDLTFIRNGPLTAILQRPLAYQIGATRDSITVPAGFVAEFASIPRSLWSELSPVGDHARAAIVHDYLYWFQPCEREETDNLLMIAMRAEGMSDLQRGAVYAGARVGSTDVWNANRIARDRGDLRVVPTGVKPTAQESWSDFRARLGKADIRGTPGRMPRQPYCDYGKSQQVP